MDRTMHWRRNFLALTVNSCRVENGPKRINQASNVVIRRLHNYDTSKSSFVRRAYSKLFQEAFQRVVPYITNSRPSLAIVGNCDTGHIATVLVGRKRMRHVEITNGIWKKVLRNVIGQCSKIGTERRQR